MYVIIGWLLDRFFGDPANLPHPIVWFGKAIAALEKRFNCGTGRRVKGALVAIGLVALVFGASWLLIHYAFRLSYGLGLALCREIISRCGGEIQVSSRLNEGSVFTVILPLKK